jgi:hypothetical protein
VLALTLQQGRAAPNAQLRVLNPFVVLAAGEHGDRAGDGPSVKTLLPSVSSSLRAAQLNAPNENSTPPPNVGGVSSFGYSGTIAHALLSAQPERALFTSHASGAAARPVFCARSFPWAALMARHSQPQGKHGDSLPLPFLGSTVTSVAGSKHEQLWEQRFSGHELAFLSNHRVGKVRAEICPYRAP